MQQHTCGMNSRILVELKYVPEDHLTIYRPEAIRYQRRTIRKVAEGEKTTPRGVGKKTLLAHIAAVPDTNTMLLFFVISVRHEMPEQEPGLLLFSKLSCNITYLSYYSSTFFPILY
jgi:hypothetical protein